MKPTQPGIDRIEDLEVFVRIVERGSLTGAGVSLGMSTPLVCRRLSALEQALGVRLLDRSSRMLVLTAHGREFHARAETILRLAREAAAALHVKAGEVSGMLRVSLPTTVSIGGFLEEFVGLFVKHPALSIEMRLSDRPVDVIALGLDAAFYLTDAPDRHPGDLILGRHPTCLAACPSYLDRAGRPTDPEQLSQHSTVRAVSSRGTAASWALTHVSGREYVLPPAEAMFLSDDLRMSYNAVTAGAGIGRMPLGWVARSAECGKLELVMPEWRFRPIALAARLRHSGKHSTKLTVLMELIMNLVQRYNALADRTPLAAYYQAQVALDSQRGTSDVILPF